MVLIERFLQAESYTLCSACVSGDLITCGQGSGVKATKIRWDLISQTTFWGGLDHTEGPATQLMSSE